MTNDKNKYDAVEVAAKILEKVQDMYKNSNLYKSNTSHEIEPGAEPKTHNAECPESLQASKEFKKSKKKHGEGGKEGEIPEHEENLSPEEKAVHDATESMSDEEESERDMDAEAYERDEEDPDIIEENQETPEEQMGNEEVDAHEDMEERVEEEDGGDSEEEDEEEDEEEGEGKKSKYKKNQKVSDKEKEFEKSEEFNKAPGLKSPKLKEFIKNRQMKKAKEKSSANYTSDEWMRDRGKFKEQREASRDPKKDFKNRQYRKRTPKKAVVVDKDRAKRIFGRKRKDVKKIEKMLGIKDAKKEYKELEAPKPPKVNEGY